MRKSIRDFMASLEIERKHNHLRCSLRHRLREFEFIGVVHKVGTVVYEHVGQSETEFYFGIELEIRQIEITAEADGQINVRRIQLKEIAAFLGHVESRHHAPDNIWACVTVAYGGELEVDGQHHESRFDILALGGAGSPFAHGHVAAAEIQAGRYPQREIVVQAQIEKAVHAETGLVAGLLQ